ncbi:MAG TPA: NAD(P)H-hydrate dehydratase [Syntrophales bacterium]|nr:NAD(P)H-hydrate dehydratase [Syntrophales bacterium]HPQ44435.1 NAD(P)H-hydrate dehydratase [Syntrophales bacterium]
MKVSSVAQMRELDRAAIEEFGIEDNLLMENAGFATCTVIQSEFGIKGKKFIVFCGIGNNGGDGFVIARKIHSNGGTVTVCIVGDPDRFTGSARMNLEIIRRLPVDIEQVKDAESLRIMVAHSDAIIDAIFGTGLTRDVADLHRDVIDLINASGKTVFSVDIPSGINGDTGMVMGAAVRADYTITFGLPKTGNMLFPGFDLCGKLYVTHISFPPSHYNNDFIKVEINSTPKIPPRNANAHKGNLGDVLFVAGASGYMGAPYFAAYSFMKAGGGYARLAAPRSITPFIAGKGSEIVFIPQEETTFGGIALKNKDALLELSEKVDMVVLGPGLSLDGEVQALVRDLAYGINKPILIDGDGITALCVNLHILRERKAPTILTPHLGEMSRITGVAVDDIRANRIEVLQKTASNLQAIVVMKGAHSLIGYPDGRVFINLSGNAGMATAGSGDVLTGTIAAMFGLGLSIEDAVRKGVFIHGFSGDLAAGYEGEDGITAQDIMDYLPLAVRTDREGLDEALRVKYEGSVIL